MSFITKKTPEKMLIGLKPSVAHPRTFDCRAKVRVPGKTRKALEAKARPRVLLCALSINKYRVVLESNETFEIFQHCVLNEIEIPMKKLKNCKRVSEDHLRESVVIDEDDETFRIRDLYPG